MGVESKMTLSLRCYYNEVGALPLSNNNPAHYKKISHNAVRK
jgi:hypothetical protein